MLVCYIRLLYDQSFRLFLHKEYTCYSVPYYQFSLYFQRLPRRLLGVLLNTPTAFLQRGTIPLPTSGHCMLFKCYDVLFSRFWNRIAGIFVHFRFKWKTLSIFILSCLSNDMSKGCLALIPLLLIIFIS